MAHGFCGLSPATAPSTISKTQDAKLQQGFLAHRSRQGAKMSIRFGQGLSSDHLRPSLRSAFAITMSFLMIAVTATLPDLPARMS
jgi:hypothetical protein